MAPRSKLKELTSNLIYGLKVVKKVRGDNLLYILYTIIFIIPVIRLSICFDPSNLVSTNILWLQYTVVNCLHFHI